MAARRVSRTAVVAILAALPALWLALQLWRAFHHQPHALGREPVKGLEHQTGDLAIRFLAASLAVTPLRRLAGWNWLARYRRVLGLCAFAYATAHLATFVVLDLELNLGDVSREIAKRPFITVGFAAWLLLVPLAVTSTKGWIRRLGKTWTRLHRLVYLVALLGVVHYWWSQKKDRTEPLIWGAAFAALLLLRLAPRAGVRSPARPAAESDPTPRARRAPT